MADDTPPRNWSTSPDRPSRSASSVDSALSPSVAFEALSDRRSRFVLYLLEARGGTVPLEELAGRLAAWERERSEGASGDLEERVYARLHHAVVPKLADVGLVIYDRDSKAVTLSARCDRLRPYLEFARTRECEEVAEFLDRCGRIE